MKIVYTQNPFFTKVKLTKMEKQDFWYKIKVEIMEDLLFHANFYLKKEKYFDLEKVKSLLNPNYYIGEDNEVSKLDQRVDELFHYYLDILNSNHIGDCICLPAACSKCSAENYLKINTLEGLDKYPARIIDSAYTSESKTSINEALDNLSKLLLDEKDNSFMMKTNQMAYDWLLRYKEKHFPNS